MNIRNFLKKSYLFDLVWCWRKRNIYFCAGKELKEWEKQGKPIPPPHAYKIQTLINFHKKYKPTIFIETGTFWGSTLWHMKNKFEKCYSIELSQKLYEYNKKFFSKYKKVNILHGDSGEVLKNILPKINKPCLFWLDAHYSGEGNSSVMGDSETPIVKELDTILDHKIKNHIIIIDDARNFIGNNGYPKIETVESLIKTKNSELKFEVFDDLIRIYPKNK
jgi:hypothetical protein